VCKTINISLSSDIKTVSDLMAIPIPQTQTYILKSVHDKLTKMELFTFPATREVQALYHARQSPWS